MRAGGCTLQQALTPEATAVVKQAVALARRRGHAQVTPLHVASTMLSSSSGLLRAACLQSHSHPLQCKALELCFNVALNRLPASTTSSPILSPHHYHHSHHYQPPSLSNALVAAFKRAQAHQRRGSIDSQQQPLLAVKIEIEQLVISILDDPSVSRVMREAGFSSTQVKTNVEQAVSMEICTTTTPSPSSSHAAAAITTKPKREEGGGGGGGAILTKARAHAIDQSKIRNEDVLSVMDCLVSKRKRSVVVVGESLGTTEGVVRGVMDKVERGEAPEPLRTAQFIILPLFSFAQLSKEEVEHKVAELRCLVKSCCVGSRGAVLYLGDLRWAAEYRASCGGWGEKGRTSRGYYCPVEHVIMEVGRLACSGGVNGEEMGRFWVVGVATYQTYMRCRVGCPSLESLWALHPLTVPAGSLDLSLSCDSDLQTPSRSHGKEDGHDQSPMSSTLPSWLQQYKDERKVGTNSDQEHLQTRDLCKQWNFTFNSSPHKQHHFLPEKTLNFSLMNSSLLPTSSTDQHYSSPNYSHQPWPLSTNGSKYPWKEHHFFMSNDPHETHRPDKRIHIEDLTTPASTPPHHPNPNLSSTSPTDAMEMEYRYRFKELNAENLKALCNELEKKVPWQAGIIPEIASTVLQCRSGMVRRKAISSTSLKLKEDTWLLFQGCDSEGKEKISRELARLVFGSDSSFHSIALSDFALAKPDSMGDSRNKRSRDSESSHCYLEELAEAIKRDPHRVFLLEDIEQVDYHSQVGIKNAMERGRVRGYDGEEVAIEDAIVVLCCESFDKRSRTCSPPIRQKLTGCDEEEDQGKMANCEEEESSSCVSLDLNLLAEEEEDDAENDQSCFDDAGLLEAVDRRFFFKSRDDDL